MEAFGARLAADRAKLLQHIPQLPCLQSAWLLLYFCAVPRINHLLRTLPPRRALIAAASHDISIREVFQNIFGIASRADWSFELHGITYDNWVHQSTLPLRLGGMGLRDSARTAPAAFWASWADSLPDSVQQFPGVGRNMLFHLSAAQNAPAGEEPCVPACISEAERAGRTCTKEGGPKDPRGTTSGPASVLRILQIRLKPPCR